MGMIKELYSEMEERIQDLESQSACEGAYIEFLETELDALETEMDKLAYALDGLGKELHALSGRIAGRIDRAEDFINGR